MFLFIAFLILKSLIHAYELKEDIINLIEATKMERVIIVKPKKKKEYLMKVIKKTSEIRAINQDIPCTSVGHYYI